MRIQLLAALVWMVTAGHAAEGYAFPLDQPQWYSYAVQQEVAWSSAGDDLTFTSSLLWYFALRADRVEGDQVVVKVTITRIIASLAGPAAAYSFDSRDAKGSPDPLFGHLAALETTLTLTVNQPTGRVIAVAGAEDLIARLERLTPGNGPGLPSPFAPDYRAAYSAERLAAWWTEILALPALGDGPIGLPGTTPTIPLTRAWGTDGRFRVSLLGDKPRLTLADEPTPVTAVVESAEGEGATSVTGGMPGPRSAEIRVHMALMALTQPVTQRQVIRWALLPITREEASP